MHNLSGGSRGRRVPGEVWASGRPDGVVLLRESGRTWDQGLEVQYHPHCVSNLGKCTEHVCYLTKQVIITKMPFKTAIAFARSLFPVLRTFCSSAYLL